MRNSNAVTPFRGEGVLLGRAPGRTSSPGMGFGRRGIVEDRGPRGAIWDRGDNHIAVFAPTGAGKSLNLLIPILLSTTDSVIAIDVKGELARSTARFRHEVLGQDVHIVDPWKCVTDEGACINPLDAQSATPDAIGDDMLALAGDLNTAPSLRDPFWDGRSQLANAGVLTHLVTTPDFSDRSIGRLWEIMHADDLEYELAVLLDKHPGMHPYARAQISSLLSISANDTRSGVISTIRQHLRLFGSQAVRKALSTTTIDLDGVVEGRPQTIYFVIPPAKLASHGGLLRLWVSSLMRLMTGRRAAPERGTLLLLDELAQLGHMPELVQAVTLMRGYGLRCMLMLQSYAQLRALYPVEHEVLIENCGSIVTFGHTSMGMSNQLSSLLGDVSATQLFDMGPDELAVRQPRKRTAFATRVDYVRDPEFAGLYDLDFRYAPPKSEALREL